MNVMQVDFFDGSEIKAVKKCFCNDSPDYDDISIFKIFILSVLSFYFCYSSIKLVNSHLIR